MVTQAEVTSGAEEGAEEEAEEEEDYQELKEYFNAFPIYPPRDVETYAAAAILYRN